MFLILLIMKFGNWTYSRMIVLHKSRDIFTKTFKQILNLAMNLPKNEISNSVHQIQESVKRRMTSAFSQ